jgi:hypothetical protein
MKWFNLDQHCSVNSDLEYIWKQLGHAIDIWSISGHSWVMNRERKSVPLVENNIGSIIEKELWKEIKEIYGEKLSGYDGFLCCYPPCFCLLYRELPGRIVLHIPIRYDHPWTDNDAALREYHSFLHSPRVTPCANNMLDKLYFEDRVGRECRYIPSLCEYIGMKWNPKMEDFLLYDESRRIQIDGTVNRYDLHPHTWNDIQSFKGIIHIPYNFSTMSFFEQYTAGIPLFYPTKEFLIKMYHSKMALEQCFWTHTQHGKYGFDTMEACIEHADFYSENFPHVILFNSKADLEDKMYDDALLEYTHAEMMKDNEVLRKKVYAEWMEVLDG